MTSEQQAWRKHCVGEWEFDLSPSGGLGHLRYGGVEVVRGLQLVVRDEAWGTVEGEVTVTISKPTDSSGVQEFAFEARLAGTFGFPEGVLTCEAVLSVRGEEVRYEFDAVSRGRVWTNRVGLVVLHPLSLSGLPVVVRHTDGSSSESTFPGRISPHQPFTHVAGLVHDVPAQTADASDERAKVEVLFEGEEFESEDQRNWSDASFKTYSRPLSWPFPYEVGDGQRVGQAVTVRVLPAEARPKAPRAFTPPPGVRSSASVDVDWSSLRRRPALGVQLGPDDVALSETDLANSLASLPVDYARLDVVAEEGILRGAEALNRLQGDPLELAIHVGVDPDAALAQLADTIRARAAVLSAVLVFDADAPTTSVGVVTSVRSALGAVLDGVPLIAGTDDNFAELNRNPPAVSDVAGIGFSLNPQVHDSSDRAILETVEAVPAMIDTARSLATQGAVVEIGALTLRPRRVIYREGPVDRLLRDEHSVDPRQQTSFTAAWLTATLAALVAAGVERITAFELTGPRGVTTPGGLSPAGDVIADFAEVALIGQPVLDLTLDVAAIPLMSASGPSVLIANLNTDSRAICVNGVDYDFAAYQTRLIQEGAHHGE